MKDLLPVPLADFPGANPDHMEIDENPAINLCVRTGGLAHAFRPVCWFLFSSHSLTPKRPARFARTRNKNPSKMQLILSMD
jgi:hypothetical protein